MHFRGSIKKLILLTALSLNVPALAAEPVSHMIEVNGATLEYLDWGGSGPPMLFLAGMGDTPYIFNDLTLEFTSQFHSYGLTRRGHGRSEATPTGYTLEELAGDVVEFINKMNLTDVTLVGHSYGGTEVMRIAQLIPDKIDRAVVLDVTYAFRQISDEPSGAAFEQVVPLFMPPQEIGASIDNYRKFMTWMHHSWSDAAEANLREQAEIGPDGSLTPRMPPFVGPQFGADRQNWFLTHMPVPALFIFSHNPSVDLAEGLEVSGALLQEVAAEDAALSEQRRIQIETIRQDSPHATIVKLEHTSHRNFIQRHDRVVEEMKRFLH